MCKQCETFDLVSKIQHFLMNILFMLYQFFVELCFEFYQVIMDFSFQNDILVRRVLRTNENFVNELKFQALNSSLATVIKVFKNKKQELIAR